MHFHNRLLCYALVSHRGAYNEKGDSLLRDSSRESYLVQWKERDVELVKYRIAIREGERERNNDV